VTRVIRARRSSLLACGYYVHRGRQIVKPDGQSPWICMGCHLATLDEAFIRQLGDRTGHRGWPRKVQPLDYGRDDSEELA
jgi:hypothetical protein